MMSRTLFALGTLCLAVLTLPQLTRAAVVTFSGSAAADFAAVPDTVVFPDLVLDVTTTLPFVSGWDVQNTYFHFDTLSDTLYVGISGNGVIIGDADGDGDPSSFLAGTDGVVDRPNLDDDETVILCVRARVTDVVRRLRVPHMHLGHEYVHTCPPVHARPCDRLVCKAR